MMETRQKSPGREQGPGESAWPIMKVRFFNGLLAVFLGFLAVFSPPLAAGCISWRCEYFDDTLTYGPKGRRRNRRFGEYCRGRTKELWERLYSRHDHVVLGPQPFLKAITGVYLIATFLIALVTVFPHQITGRLALFTGASWAPAALAPVLATIAVIPAFWIEIKRYRGMRSLGPYFATMPAYFAGILLSLLTISLPDDSTTLFPFLTQPGWMVVAVGLILVGAAIIPAFVWDQDELFWYRGDPFHTFVTVLYALSVLLCLIISCTERQGWVSSFLPTSPGAALVLALTFGTPAIILLLRNFWMLVADLYLLNLLFISLMIRFPDRTRAAFASVGKYGWVILALALALMGVSAILVIREVIQLARVSDQAESERVRVGY